jgi:hypothetical protein
VDGAMSDVGKAEVSAAADSVTGTVDGYENTSAGICIGTETECAKEFADRAQREADQMTPEQAMKALDGQFLHDPTALSPAQVKGLEALANQPHLSAQTKDDIRSFLDDHYHGVDRLGLDGKLGRFD